MMQPFGGRIPDFQVQAPQIDVPAPKKKTGMFGSGANVGEIISALINGALVGSGNPAGAMGLQMLNQRRRDASEQSQYQQRRSDSFEDWVKQQAYKAANPGEDEFSQMMIRAGIDPNSPQGKQMYAQALQNKVNPFVAITQQNADGSEQRQFIRPPMMGQPPAAPVGQLTPLDEGGPALGGPGGFRF